MAQGDVTVGVISTVTDDTNIIRDVSDVIDFLSPWDTPFLDMVGKDSLRDECEQVKHEWLEDELEGRSGTLLSAYVAGSGVMVLAADQGKYLLPDDLIQLISGANRLVFRVTSGAPDSDTLGVSYVGGTGDTALAAAVTWEKIAHAAQEGGEARTDMKKTELGNPFNYTQIIKDWAIVTGTMRSIRRYGYVSERAYQEEKLLRRLAIDLEKNILYGVRGYTAGPPRKSSMGGLMHYVLVPGITGSWSTVVNAAGGAITETMLNNVLQEMWNLGGNPDFITVNGTNKRFITAWAGPRIRTEREERTAGASIGRYESDFGVLDIILDRWLIGSDVVIGTRGSMGIGPLSGRQFSSRLLPVTGDYDRYEILGEYTAEVHKPTMDFGWIYNTATAYS